MELSDPRFEFRVDEVHHLEVEFETVPDLVGFVLTFADGLKEYGDDPVALINDIAQVVVASGDTSWKLKTHKGNRGG